MPFVIPVATSTVALNFSMRTNNEPGETRVVRNCKHNFLNGQSICIESPLQPNDLDDYNEFNTARVLMAPSSSTTEKISSDIVAPPPTDFQKLSEQRITDLQALPQAAQQTELNEIKQELLNTSAQIHYSCHASASVSRTEAAE